MLVAVLILALIVIVCVVLALATWGVTTSATGLTLAAGNTALAASNTTLAQANTTAQTTITFLVIVLVVLTLVIGLGASAVFVALHRRENSTNGDARVIVPHSNEPTLIQAVPTPLQLPAPGHLAPFVRVRPSPVRMITRKRRSSNQAAHIAAAWFNRKTS